MIITQPVCVFVALGIQHAMHMRHIVICDLPALQYFSTLSHERHYFRVTENIEHKMCVVIFSTRFV
jgi:serine kinase of HPr protein (carbohydrate metabolism regulator)